MSIRVFTVYQCGHGETIYYKLKVTKFYRDQINTVYLL